MATTLAMLESRATTAEKLILMLRQQIGEARAAQVVKTSNFFFCVDCNYENYYEMMLREDSRRLHI